MNTSPTDIEIQKLREALNQFNEKIVGDDGYKAINITEHDESGNLIGGIIGGTYWGWMHIDVLWVHENHRRNGLGTKLLLEAEKEACRRKCHHVHLETMSWQAPEFYKKHGYEIIGVLPDIPSGHKKYLLVKKL